MKLENHWHHKRGHNGREGRVICHVIGFLLLVSVMVLVVMVVLGSHYGRFVMMSLKLPKHLMGVTQNE